MKTFDQWQSDLEVSDKRNIVLCSNSHGCFYLTGHSTHEKRYVHFLSNMNGIQFSAPVEEFEAMMDEALERIAIVEENGND